MPFIGQQPKIGAYKLLDSITTSATATYALTASSTAYFPELAQNLIVSLNGVTQAPISAYTVSGSNIVFASALTSSDVIDYILALGDVLSVGSTTNPALPDLTDVNINTGTLAGTHILGYSTVSSAWVNGVPSTWSIPNTSQAISTITWQSSNKSLNITRADANFGALVLTDVAMEDTDVTFDDLTCEGSFSVSNSVYTHMTVGSGKTRIHNDLQVDGIVTATTFRQIDTGTNAFSLASNGRITTGENLIVTGDLTVDTDTLVVDSTNNRVGIGESSPSALLHITGNNANIALDPTGTNAYFDNRKVGGVTNFRVSSSSTLDTTAMVIAANGDLTVGRNAIFQKGIEEQQYSLTGTVINPANGTIQYKTLGANTTFTESLADGEFVTLMIDDGSGRTITWPTTTWVGGSAPTLETSGYNIIELWQVNGTLYGAFVGAA